MFRSRQTIMLVVGIAAVIAVFFGAYRLLQVFDALTMQCDVTVKQQIASPAHRRHAVVFEKDCGATTPFNTQVGIAAEEPSTSSEMPPSFLSLKGRHVIAVRWLNDETVQIEIPKGAETFRQEDKADGVTILYR